MFFRHGATFRNNAADTSAQPSGNTTTTTPSTPTSTVSNTPAPMLTADDVFNAATKDIENSMEGEDVVDDDGNIVEPNTENPDAVDKSEPQNVDADIPLYVFEGKVMGKEHSMVIQSKEQLDKIISQGQAAKQIIPEFKRLREENTSLRTKAERADAIDELVKTDPKAFLATIADSLDENVVADWVYDQFHAFKKLADMTEEEQTRERRLKMADKMLREQEKLAKQTEIADKRNQEAKINLEYQKLKNWRDETQNKFKGRVDSQYHSWVDSQIKSVMITYNSLLKVGEETNIPRLNKLIDQAITPLLDRISKKDVDKVVHNTLNDKSNTATRELQNFSRQQTQKPQKPSGPMNSDQIWDGITKMVDAGKLRLGN